MARRGADDTRPAPTHAIARTWAFGLGGGQASAGERRLPMRPLWGAFAASATLWGALLLVPWTGWRGVGLRRRRRRIRRGACDACGYDLAGGMACPECGAQAPPDPPA